jgi:hypothetical protein
LCWGIWYCAIDDDAGNIIDLVELQVEQRAITCDFRLEFGNLPILSAICALSMATGEARIDDSVPPPGWVKILAALRWTAEQNFAEADALYGEWRGLRI